MSSLSSNVISCAATGDLVSTTSKAYREKLEQAIAAAPAKATWTMLELDLRAARFIDSVGINLIILMIRRMKERSCSVRVLISSPNLKRVLSFMRVDQHAEIILA